MADVTVVAAEVLPDSGTVTTGGTLGGTVTAGQSVYLDSTTNTWKAADANSTAATAAAKGISMTGGVSGQPCVICTGGTLDPGFTVDVAKVYVVSATAGGIAPVADLVQGWRTTILGVGITASQLQILTGGPFVSGATWP